MSRRQPDLSELVSRSHGPIELPPPRRARPVAVPKGMSAAQINAFLRSLPRPVPEDFGLPPFADGQGDGAA